MLDQEKSVFDSSINHPVDEQIFTELTPEEASIISGGFRILNDTDKKIYFYTLDDQFDPQRQSVDPNGESSFTGDYVLYDKTPGVDFNPILAEVSGDKLYRFNVADNELKLTSGYQHYRAKQ